MSPPYVRLRCLRGRIDRSLSSPHLLTGHYGDKTGGGLVTVAQVARIAPVAAWRGLRALLQVRNNAVGGRTVLIVCRTTSRLRNNHFDTQNFDGLHVWDKRKPPASVSHISRRYPAGMFSSSVTRENHRGSRGPAKFFTQPVKSDQSATERPRPKGPSLDRR